MLLRKNIPLKRYSSFKIGGPASYFCEFGSIEELKQALLEWQKINGDAGKIFVIGSGTNILFSDSGYEGLVIKNNIDYIERNGSVITAGSGTEMSDLVNFCSQNSLSGFEWAGGLPGTVGGGIRGNAGAFLGEMGDKVIEVESINVDRLKIKIRNRKQCGFGYRQSIFKNGEGGLWPVSDSEESLTRRGGPLARREIILSAKFKLQKGNQKEIRRKTQEKIDYRIDRHPLNLPNIGSAFKNIDVRRVPPKVLKEFRDKIKPDPFPVLPVAKLLVGASLKGRSIGGAKFSEKHPNFIVNFNNATAEDVKALIELAKKVILDKYSISLEKEIMVV